MLTWEGLSVCSTVSCDNLWEVMPKLCFSRDSEGMQEVLAEKDLIQGGIARRMDLASSRVTGLKVCRCP